jgi:hypothetical protein
MNHTGVRGTGSPRHARRNGESVVGGGAEPRPEAESPDIVVVIVANGRTPCGQVSARRYAAAVDRA